MPRSCKAAHEDSKVEAQKGGEIDHIATGHGPMVQGKLLTVHTGGVHSYGWSPGGGSSFRQGAGAASPCSPDLETAAAAVQRGVSRERDLYYGFPPRRVNIGEGGHRGDPRGSQEGPWRGQGWGRAICPPGCLVVAPLPSLGDSGSFRCADFLYIFPGIFGAILMVEKPEIQKQQKTETGNWVH